MEGADDVVSELRLHLPRLAGVEDRVIDMSACESARRCAKRGTLVGRSRHLQRAAALVLDRLAGVPLRAANELVVHRQAAHAELEERCQVTFDVRGEHAGRRPGGAEPDATLVNETNGDAAGGK